MVYLKTRKLAVLIFGEEETSVGKRPGPRRARGYQLETGTKLGRG